MVVTKTFSDRLLVLGTNILHVRGQRYLLSPLRSRTVPRPGNSRRKTQTPPLAFNDLVTGAQVDRGEPNPPVCPPKPAAL